VNKGVWKEAVGENAHEKTVESCNRCKRVIRAMEREGIPFVERRKGGGERICEGIIKEGIYLAI